jgi:short-subunit dehydrogenase
MVKEFLPAMVKQNHGHIVTLASMASYSVHAGNVDYACSKASALAFHEGLAQEIKSRYKAPKVRTT